ncbi:MAG: hypothetical protein ACI8PP_000757 [Candidatus Pseudothioglobus sp.]|jgi:hypothetical protein
MVFVAMEDDKKPASVVLQVAETQSDCFCCSEVDGRQSNNLSAQRALH